MIVHECFHQEIQFHNWVFIYLFIYLFLSGTIFIDFEEKEARIRHEYIFYSSLVFFLSIFLFKIRIFSYFLLGKEIELKFFANAKHELIIFPLVIKDLNQIKQLK